MTDYSNNVRINIHIITCGDISSGKTCVIKKYTRKYFNDMHNDVSNAVDFSIYNTNVNMTNKISYDCKLHIFDLSGDKIFEDIAKPYINMSDICILCFDTKNITHTIKYITDWLNTTIHYKKNIYILGTKYDICNTELDNIHEMAVIISEYSKIWYSYKNVQFIGVCSAKYNRFYPWAINFTSDKMGEYDHIKQYDINDMFSFILSHYIKNCMPIELLQIKNEVIHPKNNNDNNEDNSEDVNHCSFFCCF